MNTGFNETQELLHQLMSETSERAYRAGWMDGTEYRLWAFMTDIGDDGEWGRVFLDQDLRADLLRLSMQAGGWISWQDADEPGFAAGPIFVAKAVWERHYGLVA